jgi:hypothetical protein
MTFHLDIPDSVADSLRLPFPEVEARLKSELAIVLYAQGILRQALPTRTAAVREQASPKPAPHGAAATDAPPLPYWAVAEMRNHPQAQTR